MTQDPLGLEIVWMIRRFDGDGWWRQARCAGRVSAKMDPWFSEPNSATRNGYSNHGETADGSLTTGTLTALATCAICPVQRECLASALEPVGSAYRYDERRPAGRLERIARTTPEFGVFGGVLASERVGRTRADIDELLEHGRRRAVQMGLAPADIL